MCPEAAGAAFLYARIIYEPFTRGEMARYIFSKLNWLKHLHTAINKSYGLRLSYNTGGSALSMNSQLFSDS